MNSNTTDDNFSRKLATLCNVKGFTQGQMASVCGNSRISVNRYFTGKSEIRSGGFVRLLSALGIDLEAQVDQILKNKLNGVEDNNQNLPQDFVEKFSKLKPQAQKTLMDQLNWWGRLDDTPRIQPGITTVSTLYKTAAFK